jgi:hypothetical protein
LLIRQFSSPIQQDHLAGGLVEEQGSNLDSIKLAMAHVAPLPHWLHGKDTRRGAERKGGRHHHGEQGCDEGVEGLRELIGGTLHTITQLNPAAIAACHQRCPSDQRSPNGDLAFYLDHCRCQLATCAPIKGATTSVVNAVGNGQPHAHNRPRTLAWPWFGIRI